MKPLSRTLRWWHLAILGVVLLLALLVCTAWVVRAMGRAHYQEVLSGLKAAGHPASVDDLVALAPVVDRALQARWDAWQTSLAANKYSIAVTLDSCRADLETWVAGTGPRPERIVEVLADREADFAPALQMLQHGGLVLSRFGWMAEDLPPGRRTLPFVAELRMPNLTSVLEVAVWLRHRAVLADDPHAYLAGLDALVGALARPAKLDDALTAMLCAEWRDRAYLDLAMRGRLPAQERERWLAEPCRLVALIGDGFQGQSVLSGMSMAAMLDESPLAQHLPTSWRTLRHWMQEYEDCALLVSTQTRVAQRLRGTRTGSWPEIQELMEDMGVLGISMMPDTSGAAINALQGDAAHRQARLAVRLIGLARSQGLPTDQAALVRALGDQVLKPAGDHLHLLYEVLDPGSFRLAVDPASPLPDFAPSDHMAWRTRDMGVPDPVRALVWDRNGALELRVPPFVPAGTP